MLRADFMRSGNVEAAANGIPSIEDCLARGAVAIMLLHELCGELHLKNHPQSRSVVLKANLALEWC